MVYHLTIDRPSDLNSSVFQARSRFRRSPGLIVADMFCLWQEIQHDSRIDLLLSQLTSPQELFCLVGDRAEDLDARDRRQYGIRHGSRTATDLQQGKLIHKAVYNV